MRFWLCLATAGSMLAIATAASLAESDPKDAGNDKPTTRPAPKSERGEKTGELRWSGRGSHGEGRSYRQGSDSLPPLDDDGAGHRDGRGFGSTGADRDHQGGPMFGPSPERVEKVMAFLKEQYPKLFDHLNELKEKDPHAYHRQMGRILPRMPELMNIIERNPALGKLIIDEHRLEMEIRDAVVEYRRAKNDSLKDQIRELISKQFDVRQEKLKLMIADMERELERKKQLLNEQATKKDKTIDRDLQRRLDPEN